MRLKETFPTATAVAVVRDLDPDFSPVALRQWRMEGWFPGRIRRGRAWYTRDDLVRLRTMVALRVRHGLSLAHAHFVAQARDVDWPTAHEEARRFLVFVPPHNVQLVTASQLLALFTMPHPTLEELFSYVGTAIVIDAALQARFVNDKLARLENGEPQ